MNGWMNGWNGGGIWLLLVVGVLLLVILRIWQQHGK